MGESEMEITLLAIDLAKRSFQLTNSREIGSLIGGKSNQDSLT
jgi:hypothetical protein